MPFFICPGVSRALGFLGSFALCKAVRGRHLLGKDRLHEALLHTPYVSCESHIL